MESILRLSPSLFARNGGGALWFPPLLASPLDRTGATEHPTTALRGAVLWSTEPTPKAPGEAGESPAPPGHRFVLPAFSEVLEEFLRQVDQTQHRADSLIESLALGEPIDVHQVMLALNEASSALHLTLQVRGKILEAYQELMRLPL